jgi:histidinol-phosphate aminotransferase
MALRERIAAINGCGVENVFVGNGSDEVLRVCTRAFTQPGGAVASFTPSYSLYPVLAAAEEVGFRAVPLGGRVWLDRAAGDWMPRCFGWPIPMRPPACAIRWRAIRAFCRRFPGVVVVDEAYVDFAGGRTCLALALEMPNVLVCRTLSKSFSLAGLRLGYAIGAPDLIGALYKLKDSYNVDRLAQAVAFAALGDLPWMQANARPDRGHPGAGFGRTPTAGIPGGSVGRQFPICRARNWGSAADLFADLRSSKILVRYFPGGRTDKYLRVTIGTDAQMDAFLAALG